MAIKEIISEEGFDSSANLPLVRDWVKKQVKLGNDPYESYLAIRMIKLSKSEEWVVIQTEECIALVNADSQLGQSIWSMAVKLEGEGRALVLCPKRNGKLGFSIGMDDDQLSWYHWNEEEGYLNIANSKVKQVKEIPLINPEDILTRSPVNPNTEPTESPKVNRRAKRELRAV